MSVSRRDFVKGSLGALAAALIPFHRDPCKLLAGPKCEYVVPQIKVFESFTVKPQVASPEHYHYYLESCILAIPFRPTRLLAQGVTMTFPKDPQYLKRFPCRMDMRRIVGPADDIRLLLTMGDIAHGESLLYFAIDNHGARTPVPAFLFREPMIVYAGPSFFTNPVRTDAYTGEQHPVQPQDQMGIVEGCHMHCIHAPIRQDDFHITDHYQPMQRAERHTPVPTPYVPGNTPLDPQTVRVQINPPAALDQLEIHFTR